MNLKLIVLPLENNQGTLTYLVDTIHEENGKISMFLNHPLSPRTFVKLEGSSEEAINGMQIQTQGKSYIQKQLEFVNKYSDYLDYDEKIDFRMLIDRFIVRRKLADFLKKRLANLCGKLARESCNGDLKLAIKIVNENHVLFDEFNKIHYAKLLKFYSGRQPVDKVGPANVIFNQAGLIMALLETSRITVEEVIKS